MLSKFRLIISFFRNVDIFFQNFIISFQICFEVLKILSCGVCFNFMYKLSLKEIDLTIPLLIHCDFLCLCLLCLTILVGGVY